MSSGRQASGLRYHGPSIVKATAELEDGKGTSEATTSDLLVDIRPFFSNKDALIASSLRLIIKVLKILSLSAGVLIVLIKRGFPRVVTLLMSSPLGASYIFPRLPLVPKPQGTGMAN